MMAFDRTRQAAVEAAQAARMRYRGGHVGEIPMFWACGVTPQAALTASRVPFAITHAPGHMFITDIPDSAYRI